MYEAWFGACLFFLEKGKKLTVSRRGSLNTNTEVLIELFVLSDLYV